MSSEANYTRGPTSPAHDVYEVLFLAADMYSSFWSPVLKGVGRWQLEVSQLGARQIRAGMDLAQKLARSRTSDEMAGAYREYVHDVADFYSEASRNIATAVVRAAPHAAILELPLARPRHHDKLDLVDDRRMRERKVA